MLIPLLMIAVHAMIIALSCIQGRDALKSGMLVWFVLFFVLGVFNVIGAGAWLLKLF